MHSKGPFIFLWGRGEGRILGIWVFFGEGAYWRPFFSLSARQCVFFIKKYLYWNFGKIQQKKREKKSWLYTRKTKKFQFCLNFFVKKCRNFASKKTIAKSQGKNTLCGHMVQSLFFFGAKCKELRGYGTIPFF